MTNLSDIALGNETALGGVLCAHGPAIAALLRARYPSFNEHDVEDVLIVALYRIWRNRRRFDPQKGRLGAYFFRTADRVAQDVLRSGWHKARRMEVALPAHPPSDLAEAAVKAPEDGGVAFSAQMLDDVREVIDKLPVAYRQIVVADACARDRVASAELLADELDVSPTTVRVYRNRAMQTIRTELRKRGYDVP
jgi:RNA polymerase sigma factor (sigma-70 family)